MKYNARIQILENRGIDYHRKVANFILSHLLPIYPHNAPAILVYGDKDLLISYLLSEHYRLHVANIGTEEPKNTFKIKEVKLHSFPIWEYDVIIGLFCNMKFIEDCISLSNNFFIIPQDDLLHNLNDITRNYLMSKNIPFEETEFDAFMRNRTAFYNFSLKKF